VYNGTGSISWG